MVNGKMVNGKMVNDMVNWEPVSLKIKIMSNILKDNLDSIPYHWGVTLVYWVLAKV